MNPPQNKPDPPEPQGLRCPACGCPHFWVLYTRRRRKRLMRRRECRHCGRRMTTFEKAAWE